MMHLVVLALLSIRNTIFHYMFILYKILLLHATQSEEFYTGSLTVMQTEDVMNK